jgi:hypothetical protein
MTPQEKAKELVEKFLNEMEDKELVIHPNHYAKQCALIAVEEIFKLPVCWFDRSASLEDDEMDTIEYWEQVKEEIEKL